MKKIELSEKLVNEVLALASKISNKNLLRAIKLIEPLASIEWQSPGDSGH